MQRNTSLQYAAKLLQRGLLCLIVSIGLSPARYGCWPSVLSSSGVNMTTQITLDNYLPLEQLPPKASFVSVIRTLKGKFQCHIEFTQGLNYSPYYRTYDIVGAGLTPNAAFIDALKQLNKYAKEAA
jgi:hypothetical protein